MNCYKIADCKYSGNNINQIEENDQIIERLHVEEELGIHQQDLEKLIEKKTPEYTEANEKLVHEVIERRKIENLWSFPKNRMRRSH